MSSELDLDYGLIKPLSIPKNSKVPDLFSGRSSEEEYDLYFRLKRNNPDLIDWSKNCILLYEDQLHDLDGTSLEAIEKYEILKGWLNVFQVTLEKWVDISQSEQRES
ncbi:hypothetical protein VQL36_06405 [Chengkuizengella sp. SCS-71B]|uniref:Uncharacterized protein n=1 Tax=Chengkuizengella marina TaxID=2507566 RepID=A0A6N9Q7W9_9BACL|nr:hypothetical protein [Chengkuizengella marina]NBI30753.1 hypothetical protein [Chengkuizengella marina]